MVKTLQETFSQIQKNLPEDSLVFQNLEAVRVLCESEDLVVRSYLDRQEFVRDGSFMDPFLSSQKSFSYANVPLGIILKGDVTVVKGLKGTKRLSVGDFVGLFETSDWILTGKHRQIGEWTLITEGDTEILFFGAEILRDPNAESLRVYLTELSRHDHVPQPITDMLLLDWVASHTTQNRLSDCVIVLHTHLLPNNLPLFRHLTALTSFGQVFALEKPYSTVPETRNDLLRSGVEIISVPMQAGTSYAFALKKSLDVLWDAVTETLKKGTAKKLLVLDDGGDLWTSLPWEKLQGVAIAGVEQTQRGITRLTDSHITLPPIVSVATSAIKKQIEPAFIGVSIVEKLRATGVLDRSERVGVIGMGSIGQAVFSALRMSGKTVSFYDKTIHDAPKDASAVSSLDALLNQNDLIIGATGTDALKGIAFERVIGTKTLVSASSADIEFASVLKFGSSEANPFETQHVQVHSTLAFDILNGGFPYNFDRKGNATPDNDIALTRSLLYIGMMQAAKLLETSNPTSGFYALDQVSEEHLLTKWGEMNGSHPALEKNMRENEGAMPTVWEKEG